MTVSLLVWGSRAFPVFSDNLKSVSEHPVLVRKILKEVPLGTRQGLFSQPLFVNFPQKKHSSELAHDFDLSHPKSAGNSENAYISKKITIGQKLGKGSFLAKKRYLFCLRNVLSTHWELLGMHWKGLYFRQSFYLLPFVAPPRPYCEPHFTHSCRFFRSWTTAKVKLHDISVSYSPSWPNWMFRKEYAPHSSKIGATTTASAANSPPWLITKRWRPNCLWAIHKNAPLYNSFSTRKIGFRVKSIIKLVQYI